MVFVGGGRWGSLGVILPADAVPAVAVELLERVAQQGTVLALVALGADPDAVDKNGTTPLHRAVRNRCATAVEALLDAGADPRATNGKGSTALQLAHWTTGRGGSGSPDARAQQAEIVRLLRAAGGV